MKKNIFFIAVMVLCTNSYSQIKVNNKPLLSIPCTIEQYISDTEAKREVELFTRPLSSPLFSSNELINPFGKTYYNTPTNCNARNTIGFHSKSFTAAAVWTMGALELGRGTGINHYNVSKNSWGNIPNIATDRIETIETVWGTHGFINEGEIVVAHNNPTDSSSRGLVINTRAIQGEGAWQESTLIGPEYLLSAKPTAPGVPTTAILWPAMATNGNTIHLVCVTAQWPQNAPFPANYEPNPDAPPYGYLGFPTLPLYYRSTDGGKTWEAPRTFREYGMTNFECFRVTADSYSIAVRGNHVVVIYNSKIGFINYMESKDGGDTWEKKTVYDNGMVFVQENELVEPRLVPTTSAVYIDENHRVHIVFSAQCYAKETGTYAPIDFWPHATIGMVYWNDTQPPINWQDIRGWRDEGKLTSWNWESYHGYIALPSVVGLNKFYRWSNVPNPPEYEPRQFHNHGWAIYPKILAKDSRIYVAYQSPLDYPLYFYSTEMPLFCRGIFITVSEDYGKTWNVQKNTSWISYHPELVWVDWSGYIWPTCDGEGNPIYEPNSMAINNLTENAFPSMSYNYKEDMFMLQWYFFSKYPAPNSCDVWNNVSITVFSITQNLTNIPAYKNIQEVYKGLWNKPEPELEFPQGIHDYQKASFNIYPNPTSGEFRILSSDIQVLDVGVFDVYGRKVLEQKETRSKQNEINIKHFPPGIYFVKIVTDKGIVTKKIIKY